MQSSPTCQPWSDIPSDSVNTYGRPTPPSRTRFHTLSTSLVQSETSTSGGREANAMGIAIEEMHNAVSTLDSQASHSTILANRDIERETVYFRRRNSTTARIIIVVLSAVFVLGVCALSLYCYRRRKRRKAASTDAEAPAQAGIADPSKSPEMAETSTCELDGQPIVEASSVAIVPVELHELDGQSHPVELGAGR
jgi:hypothetical protein